MSNEIVVKPISVIQSMGDVERAASAMLKSGFFADVTDLAKATVKILAGQEIGIGAFASMTGIHIIKGKPTYGANIIAAKIKASGKYDYVVDEMTAQVCKITFMQDGKSIGQSVFTIEDAKKAGTQNTEKFPRNMLFARAISNGYRWFCPDVTFVTMYTPEEFGANVDNEGNIIEGNLSQLEPHKQTIRERYQELFDEAVSLGVADTAWEVSDKMTDEEIKALGIDLRAKVDAKKEGK